MTHARTVVLLLACSVLLSVIALGQSQPFTIGIRDACDHKSFNHNVGPGTCKTGQHGSTKFKFFIAELQSDKIAGAWRFNPLLDATQGTFQLAPLNLSSGQTTALENTGGEVHTFTRVASFGGGFIPILNQLSGNPTPAPECLQSENPTNIFVEAGTTETGPTAGSDVLPPGETKWECCIHPWMRMTINVQ
jgi:plastocyanin